MDSKNQSSNNKSYLRFITFIIIVLIVTLPFHYVFYRGELKVFIKDNFSFKDTFVTEDDIDDLIERHNKANLWDKSAIRNESLHKKLIEEGIITTENRSENN